MKTIYNGKQVPDYLGFFHNGKLVDVYKVINKDKCVYCSKTELSIKWTSILCRYPEPDTYNGSYREITEEGYYEFLRKTANNLIKL